MKLFLIKLGKIYRILKKEGFFSGGKRIFLSFFSFFKKMVFWKKGDILFVTGDLGDSAWYRTHNVAEELNFHNFKCFVTTQDNPFLFLMIKNFKIFVFHRTLFTSKIKRVVEKIKAQKKEIIFDTDDLVYDPRYLQYMDYYKKMNKMEKKLYENGVGGEILRDSYVKVCTTTTSFLKEKLEKFNKKVFLIQNKLSNADLKFIEEAINLKKIKNDDKIKIGYFSGTISHNKDFASITDALFEVMDENKNVELYLFGPLDTESKLKKFSERIKQFNFVSRKKHYQNISKVDINLLPLELNNPFCESKSELKFFEAGILSVPTIASDTRTNKEAIIDGFDGFLANDQKEWIEKLNFLIKDENLRKKVGENARKKVLEKYVNKSSDNEAYYSYLRNVLLKIK